MIKLLLIWFFSCAIAGVLGFFSFRANENWAFFCAVFAVLMLCAGAAAGTVFLEKFFVFNIWTVSGHCVLSLGIIALVYYALSCIAKKKK